MGASTAREARGDDGGGHCTNQARAKSESLPVCLMCPRSLYLYRLNSMPVVPSSPPGGAADDVEAAPERARRVAVPPASAVVRRGRSAKRPKADDDRAEEIELWGGGSSSERSTERSVIGRAESEAGRAAREEAVAAGVGLGLFEPVRSIWLPTNGFWSASSLLVAFAVTVLCRAVEGDEGLWPVARQAAIAFCVGWSAQLIVLVAGRKLEERVCALPADVCEDRRAMPLLASARPRGSWRPL